MAVNLQDINYRPDMREISDFINNPLFDAFLSHMKAEYQTVCKIEYSKDVYFPGWNVKFRKAGRALCAVYPRVAYFTVLVVIGSKEKEHVTAQLPHLSKEFRDIYHSTKEGNGQRWLMIDLKSADKVYHDVLTLIQIRRGSTLKRR